MILGAGDLTKPESTKRVYEVENIYFHPKFGFYDAFNNDFAILELRKTRVDPDPMGSGYRPVCLIKSVLALKDTTSLVVAGWGSATANSSQPNPSLKKVTLNLINYRSCQPYYGSALTESMFCARGNSDLCKVS